MAKLQTPAAVDRDYITWVLEQAQWRASGKNLVAGTIRVEVSN